MRSYLSEILTRIGHEVATASDGCELVELADMMEPDLVITDLTMPRMDGIEAALLIKEASPATGIVILSAHNDRRYVTSLPLGEKPGWSYLLKRSVRDIGSLQRAIEGAASGLMMIDPQLITMMRTLGASRSQILGRVELPSALPFFFSGTKIAIAVAVIGAVFAEWAGASSGLGHQILIASSNLLTARMFAAITLLSLMAILLFAVVSLIERRVVTWDRR